ncbi:hypothetical protein [Streptomyces sp. 5-6(2022)]|uniref:hypothetical protein n=1 Tax=Streptomyces sp. 5-6(2022) TaxID=2936510 RepID=UPI0023BA1772|nr:hypothetical protein [Streptomyces sp. 5-6(2022)]
MKLRKSSAIGILATAILGSGLAVAPAATAVEATGMASAAPAKTAAPVCQMRISDDYMTGSVKCSGADNGYRALVTCSNGSKVVGEWTTGGWSSATCPRPQGVTRIQAQYILD